MVDEFPEEPILVPQHIPFHPSQMEPIGPVGKVFLPIPDEPSSDLIPRPTVDPEAVEPLPDTPLPPPEEV